MFRKLSSLYEMRLKRSILSLSAGLPLSVRPFFLDAKRGDGFVEFVEYPKTYTFCLGLIGLGEYAIFEARLFIVNGRNVLMVVEHAHPFVIDGRYHAVLFTAKKGMNYDA